MVEPSAPPPAHRFVLECSGACGDLGTFIPHVLGAITVAGLAPAGVLFGFAAFLIATGLFYGLPLPVQPMKAVSAVILTGGLRPGEVAAAGIMIGTVLLALGVTGWIGWLARAIPQSVSAGLQLGLGLLMAVLGLKLMLQTPWLGVGALALLFALMRVPRCPLRPLRSGSRLPPDRRLALRASRPGPPFHRPCQALSCPPGRKFGGALRSRSCRSSRSPSPTR